MVDNLIRIINDFKNFQQIEAIAEGGSLAVQTADEKSDIDIYIFSYRNIPVNERLKLVKKHSAKYEAGCEYFGEGDEFFVDKINRQLDVMYFDINWIERIVNDTWLNYRASIGYTTCFLFTLKMCRTLYDRNGKLSVLKKILDTPYPKELKHNIIKRNMMLMRDKPFASYYEQIEKALKREDLNSINHRTAAFMASYFDIIFALNELLHPGEKRLVKYARENCKILPDKFTENIEHLFARRSKDEIFDILGILDEMIINLKRAIKESNIEY